MLNYQKLLKQKSALALIASGAILAGFSTTANAQGYGYNNYDGYNSRANDIEFIRCSSQERRRNSCSTYSKIKNARVYDKLSDAPCSQGRDWGYDGKRVWVDNGCRAVFKVQVKEGRRRNTYNGGNYGGRYNDRYGYGDNYGYDRGYDRGYGRGQGLGRRDIAINNCIARAERRLYRDGFRRARFERVNNVRRGERAWRIGLTFRTRHGDHFHYPTFGCRSNRERTKLTRYDFGDQGRRCGFNFRLSSY